MNTRILILLICFFPTLLLLADKSVSIRTSDGSETMDMSGPDGFESQTSEYHSEWLDSVPYLVYHAKWKEPWALEALADCYRYGKGGVEKNMFNVLMLCDEAGGSARENAEKAYETYPYDELGLMDHVMENLVKGRLSETDAASLLDDPKAPQSAWIGFLREILRQDEGARTEYIESALGPESSPDEYLIGLTFLSISDKKSFEKLFIGISDDHLRRTKAFAEKLPPLYDVIANELWNYYYRVDTRTGDKCRDKAMEYMHLADRAGFLSTSNMVRILTYCEENGIVDLPPFSKDDLSRFQKLCHRKYGDDIGSPVVAEGEAAD